MEEEPLIRNVSDTALWIAAYRAQESGRPDALFHDRFAERLAGERGPAILRSLSRRARQTWPMVTRTWLGDRLIEECLAAGADLVLNLAAGLDTRPYRMDLPNELPWIEADLPGMIDYKERLLAQETPVCRLERIACDLSDAGARRALLDGVASRCRNALVLTEGLLVYLTAEQVAALARDLAATPPLRRWALDLQSPALIRLLDREFGGRIALAPMRFGPAEGPAYFEPFGWKVEESRPYLKAAASLGRLPFILSLIARLPQPKQPWKSRIPWAAMCLLSRA